MNCQRPFRTVQKIWGQLFLVASPSLLILGCQGKATSQSAPFAEPQKTYIEAQAKDIIIKSDAGSLGVIWLAVCEPEGRCRNAVSIQSLKTGQRLDILKEAEQEPVDHDLGKVTLERLKMKALSEASATVIPVDWDRMRAKARVGNYLELFRCRNFPNWDQFVALAKSNRPLVYFSVQNESSLIFSFNVETAEVALEKVEKDEVLNSWGSIDMRAAIIVNYQTDNEEYKRDNAFLSFSGFLTACFYSYPDWQSPKDKIFLPDYSADHDWRALKAAQSHFIDPLRSGIFGSPQLRSIGVSGQEWREAIRKHGWPAEDNFAQEMMSARDKSIFLEQE